MLCFQFRLDPVFAQLLYVHAGLVLFRPLEYFDQLSFPQFTFITIELDILLPDFLLDFLYWIY